MAPTDYTVAIVVVASVLGTVLICGINSKGRAVSNEPTVPAAVIDLESGQVEVEGWVLAKLFSEKP